MVFINPKWIDTAVRPQVCPKEHFYHTTMRLNPHHSTPTGLWEKVIVWQTFLSTFVLPPKTNCREEPVCSENHQTSAAGQQENHQTSAMCWLQFGLNLTSSNEKQAQGFASLLNTLKTPVTNEKGLWAIISLLNSVKRELPRILSKRPKELWEYLWKPS